jgi:hypothetical protein
MAKTVKTCECCGHPLPEQHATLGLTRTQLRIFQIVEKAGRAGIPRRDLMDVVYANDINGGPESENILNVHRTNMNRRLSPHGLTISVSRGHYSIWKVESLVREGDGGCVPFVDAPPLQPALVA